MPVTLTAWQVYKRGLEKGTVTFSLNTFQRLTTRTMQPVSTQKETDEQIVNYLLGMNGETGELTDMFKKYRYHGHKWDRDEARKELGDMMHYLFGLIELMGFTADEVATVNQDKLFTRYPKGFNQEDSKKRVDVYADDQIVKSYEHE